MEHTVDNALCNLRAGGGQTREVNVVCRPADQQHDCERDGKIQHPLARAVGVHFKRRELAVERLLEHGNLIFLFHVHHSFQLSFLRRYSLKKSMTTTTTNSDSRTVPRLL